MKKLSYFKTWLLAALLLLGSGSTWGQGTEDFENHALSGTSYVNGSFVGNNSVSWTYVQATGEQGYTITNKGILLRRSDAPSSVKSSLISGGIGSFTMKMRKAFTGAGDRQVALYINNIFISNSLVFGSVTGADATIHSFNVDNINVEGDFTIEIRHITGNTANRQLVIDDIVWTSYEATTNAVVTPAISITGVEKSADTYYSTAAVTLSTTTEGASIYYTTNGDVPTTSSTPYTVPFNVTTLSTIKAIAVKDGMDNSTVAEKTITIVAPATASIPYSEAFNNTLGDWYNYEVVGTKPWLASVNGALGNGYGGGDVESWLISPKFTAGVDGLALSFNYASRFIGNPLLVKMSTDYIGYGNPSDATWTNLTSIDAPTVQDDSYTIKTSGNIITNSEGTVYFALVYDNNTAPYSDWRITNASVNDASTPVLTLLPTSLSGFSYVQGSGPSTEETFTISGVNLDADLSIAASTNYEISKTSGTGFTTPLVFTPTDGTVSEQTVYVRLKAGLTNGEYNSEVITASSTGATNATITVSGTVFKAEPTNHVSGLTATTNSISSITLTWTDAIGAQLPEGYLVKVAVDPATPTAPSDGTAVVDASLVKNIDFGVESVQFTGLNPSTTYNFSIWPYTNSGTDINYKTDGIMPSTSATTESVAVPNVIITEVYGGGGNSGAPFTHDFVELFNTTNSVVDIGGWSIQYFSATGNSASVVTIATGSKIPAKSSLLLQLAGGSTGNALSNPDILGTSVNMAGTAGKVILYTVSVAQVVNTADITTITSNVNFKDYVPFGTSAIPVWGTAMLSNASNSTSATRKKVSGVYVYTQNIGNDFEVIAPTPQNSGEFRSKASGNWGDTSTWEFTDNGTWGNASIVPSSVSSPVQIATGHEVSVNASASSARLTLKPGAKLSINATNTLAVTGNLSLESDAINGTATLVNDGTLTVSGTSSVQQHLKEARNWYLTSPISNAKLPSGFTAFQYMEPNNNTNPDETAYWQSVAAATSLTPMKGYTMRPSAATTITFTTESEGSLNTGNQSILLTRTPDVFKSGFNLIGNPYPSHITWTNAIASGANLQSTIWYRTGVSGQYVFHTFNAAGSEGTTEGVTGVIAPMQAFWVRVAEGTASTTLNLNNTMRSHQASNPLKAPAIDNKKVLRLQVSNDNHSDETVLYFLEGASAAYDTYDSPKMFSESKAVPEIYSIVDDVDLVINGMNSIPYGVEMPIGFVSAQSGLFTIKASTLKNFDETTQIILKDKYSNEAFDLTNGESYAFSSDATASKDRFSVTFKVAGSTTDINGVTSSSLRSYQNVSNQLVVNYSGTISESMTLSVYNTMGQKLLERQMSSSTMVLEESLKSGVYLIMLNNGTTEIKSKVIVK